MLPALNVMRRRTGSLTESSSTRHTSFLHDAVEVVRSSSRVAKRLKRELVQLREFVATLETIALTEADMVC